MTSIPKPILFGEGYDSSLFKMLYDLQVIKENLDIVPKLVLIIGVLFGLRVFCIWQVAVSNTPYFQSKFK